MRSIFGWSYPPGCSGPPDDPEYCEACGAFNLDNCICPECPECTSVGDPDCYKNHGLTYNDDQLRGQAAFAEEQQKEHEAETKLWAELEQLETETMK